MISPGLRGNGQSVGPSGAREGMKQIQPIRNDPPTQAAIRGELRQHSPNQATFTGQGSQSARVTTPGQPERRYTYQAPNQSRDPAAHGAPQTYSPQYRNAPQTPQYRNAPQTNAAQYRSAPPTNAPVPQCAAERAAVARHSASERAAVARRSSGGAPQMRTMPIPSARAAADGAERTHRRRELRLSLAVGRAVDAAGERRARAGGASGRREPTARRATAAAVTVPARFLPSPPRPARVERAGQP